MYSDILLFWRTVFDAIVAREVFDFRRSHLIGLKGSFFRQKVQVSVREELDGCDGPKHCLPHQRLERL